MLLDGTLGMMGSMLSGVPWLYHWLDRVKLFSWLIFTLFCSLYFLYFFFWVNLFSLLSSTRSKITFYEEKYSKINGPIRFLIFMYLFTRKDSFRRRKHFLLVSKLDRSCPLRSLIQGPFRLGEDDIISMRKIWNLHD